MIFFLSKRRFKVHVLVRITSLVGTNNLCFENDAYVCKPPFYNRKVGWCKEVFVTQAC